MTMHPELEHALDTGLPIPEVIEIFTRHHSGPVEEHIDEDLVFRNHDINHNNRSFWDTWQPLLCHLPEYYESLIFGCQRIPSEPFFGTHKALTQEIISWLCDCNRKSNVYLIAEPWSPELHASQNSRAYVFANICSKACRFGLLYANRLSPPGSGVGQLSLQLARVYPSFRLLLTRILIDDPQIFNLSTRIQFKKLIHDPWRALQVTYPQYIVAPPVIIFRGDGYWDEELLHLICEIGSPPHSSSLLWIVSRDTNSKLPVQGILDSSVPIRYFRLPVSYDEGPMDAALILRHEFNVLRHKREEMFDKDEVWPSEQQMSELIRIVSGVSESVDVIIKFVDWEDGGGPKAHLETFLAYMVDSPSPSDEQPHCALDHFYIHALSDIPPEILQVVKGASSIIHLLHRADPLEPACLLSLGEDSSIHYLYRLALIRIDEPHGEKSCLRGFLEDPTWSRQFYIPPSESLHQIANSYVHILNHSSNLTAVLKPPGKWIQFDAKAYGKKVEKLRTEILGWLWSYISKR